jgi:translation initiation factor 2 alpha subunit (eIF-2alpha)
MKLVDALSNWLSIKKVHEERPSDLAAKDTFEFFSEILKDDHHVEIQSVSIQGPFYIVLFKINGVEQTERFFVDAVDALYEGIQNEPRFNGEC